MTYMLISGVITDKCLNTILAIDGSRYGLEEKAQKYVEDNPGTQVHIFQWCSGFESKPAVTIERLWHSDYVEPSMEAIPDRADTPPPVVED